MKIKRFQLLEKKVNDVHIYTKGFLSTINEDSIMEWISWISKSYINFKEYKNANKIRFAEEKNMKKVKAYLELEKLEKKRETLKIEANSEILYRFQEELIEKNFEDFYNLFIKDSEEEENVDLDWDIHPDIIKKYGRDAIEKKIELYKASKKYNL